MAKVSAGMGVLEPKIAILLDAEPVRVQMARVAEGLELGLISYECDGSTGMLLDDLEGVFGPGDSARAAPKGAWCLRGRRRCVNPQRGA